MDKSCFELKGSLFTLTVLQLFEDDLSLLEAQLKERVKMAPGFFNHTPLVIDLHDLPEEKQNIDFFALRELLLSLSIIPVGIKGAVKAVHTQLEAAGMAVLAEAKKPRAKTEQRLQAPQPESEKTSATQSPATAEQQDKAPDSGTKSTESESKPQAQAQSENQSPVSRPPAKIVKQTIRSGRQIYAPGGDLVIIGSVSAGAEILADGNIHIYGTLRGRALAGVRGDQSASVFCHSLQSELISIAGIYLLSDDIPTDKIGASAQVFLENEKLQIQLINQ